MSEVKGHFASTTLSEYALGTLAAAGAREVALHIDACEECCMEVMLCREMRDMEELGLLPDAWGIQLQLRKPNPAKSAILGVAGGLLTGLGLKGSGGMNHQFSPALAASHEDSETDPVRTGDHHASHVAEGTFDDDGQHHQGDAQHMGTGFTSAETAYGTPAAEGTSTYVQQHYQDTCAIQSQRLILNQFGVGVTEDQLLHEAIERGIYAPGQGTSLENVGKLMESHGVAVHREMNANVFNLTTELAQGHKVIVGVDAKELWHENSIFQSLLDRLGYGEANHALIVSGVDTSDPEHVKVIVTDPGTGDVAKQYPINEFLRAWGTSNFSMVATMEPAPQHLPEMVNFPYETGHLAMVGGAPYELAHQLSIEAAHGDPSMIEHMESLFLSVVDGGPEAEHALEELQHQFHSLEHVELPNVAHHEVTPHEVAFDDIHDGHAEDWDHHDVDDHDDSHHDQDDDGHHHDY